MATTVELSLSVSINTVILETWLVMVVERSLHPECELDERKSEDDWVEKYPELDVASKAGRGRCRNIRLECVKEDMKDRGV